MTWMLWWKLVLIVALAGFGLLAVITTIGGFADIRRMLRLLQSREAARDRDREALGQSDFR